MQTFGELMFTQDVRDIQEERGSRQHYALGYRRLGLGPDERNFIETRTHFYMATVNSDGWPYVQHRGGPAGFLTVLDEETLAFADYPGNRQYVSTGNLAGDNRVSLFLVDYPRRARLKILAQAEVVAVEDAPELAAKLTAPEKIMPTHVTRLTVTALDWNCPKYITPRFTEADIDQMLGPEMRRMAGRIEELEAELAALRKGKE
ncbi:pyridoxamine 5'-phosphate oxidase family protein [Pacificoceanicola onchidii]|uniref:pyridoxamine 5'-phosphate oxidase family protein n=1 Tax=Pacificoceanicola onchidii TaxID=2562685 RepID=UPI0010A3374F|nr:pyridoxamine 5'-phosphate oxidase family protein [Pacificoceanicola onchidii]